MTQIVPPPARTATPSPLSEEHEEPIARLILWGERGAGLYTGPEGVGVEGWIETEDMLAAEVSELGCPELVEHVAETGRWRGTAVARSAYWDGAKAQVFQALAEDDCLINEQWFDYVEDGRADRATFNTIVKELVEEGRVASDGRDGYWVSETRGAA